MDPAEKKAVVEDFDIHGVWNVPCIQEVHHMFHIGTKDPKNLHIHVNLFLNKYEHLELVDKYKQRPTDEIDTDYVCYNYHKYINKGLHYL